MVAAVTFISKMFGFIKQVLIGIKFGATSATDAYLVSLTVPTVIFATVANMYFFRDFKHSRRVLESKLSIYHTYNH